MNVGGMEGWVVTAVMSGIMGVLAFLARNSYDGVLKTLEVMTVKIDSMALTIAKADGDKRVLEAEVAALRRDRDADRALIEELRREMREMSEGVVR